MYVAQKTCLSQTDVPPTRFGRPVFCMSPRIYVASALRSQHLLERPRSDISAPTRVVYVAQNICDSHTMRHHRPHPYEASALRSQNLPRTIGVECEHAPCGLCMSPKMYIANALHSQHLTPKNIPLQTEIPSTRFDRSIQNVCSLALG